MNIQYFYFSRPLTDETSPIVFVHFPSKANQGPDQWAKMLYMSYLMVDTLIRHRQQTPCSVPINILAMHASQGSVQAYSLES